MGASERLRARTLEARFERLARERAQQDRELATLREGLGIDAAALSAAERVLASGEGDELRARFDVLATEPAGREAGLERRTVPRPPGALRA